MFWDFRLLQHGRWRLVTVASEARRHTPPPPPSLAGQPGLTVAGRPDSDGDSVLLP